MNSFTLSNRKNPVRKNLPAFKIRNLIFIVLLWDPVPGVEKIVGPGLGCWLQGTLTSAGAGAGLSPPAEL